jgi:hypothetical protein
VIGARVSMRDSVERGSTPEFVRYPDFRFVDFLKATEAAKSEQWKLRGFALQAQRIAKISMGLYVPLLEGHHVERVAGEARQ